MSESVNTFKDVLDTTTKAEPNEEISLSFVDNTVSGNIVHSFYT